MDIPLNEIKTEEISKKENIESEIINVKIIKQDKSKQNNKEKINSPQLIQQILKLSTQSIQNDYYHQNKLIKSLYSFNDSILPIIQDDFNNNINTNYNPRIHFLSQKNKLSCMNFEQTNKNNNFLLNKIEQYNDLKQTISKFKSNNKENNGNDNEQDLNLKLFLINHPLINLFKDEIDILEIKKEIEKEYQKKMKDNSDYKPSPLLNPHMINIIEPIDSPNEEEDEIIEESENSNEEEESLEEPSGSHDHSYLEIQPNEPLPPIEPMQPNEPIPPIEPIQPIFHPIHIEPIQPIQNEPHIILDFPGLPIHPIEPIDLEQNENNNNEPINEQNNQIQINPPPNLIEPPIYQIINSDQPLPNIVNPPQPIVIPPPQINIQSEINNNELMDIEEMENNQESNNDNENEEKKDK